MMASISRAATARPCSRTPANSASKASFSIRLSRQEIDTLRARARQADIADQAESEDNQGIRGTLRPGRSDDRRQDHSQGATRFIAVTIAFGTAAQAQPSNEFPPRSPPSFYDIVAPPPLTPADMMSCCVYYNRIYSLDAGLCIGRTPYVCFPSPGPFNWKPGLLGE